MTKHFGDVSLQQPVNSLLRTHRGLLLAWLFCSAALAILIFTRLPDFHLRLEMSSSAHSTAQLFFDAGRGWNERDSRKAAIASSSLGDFRTLVFNLPPENISQFRFDPLDLPGTFIVRNVRVIEGSRVLLHVSSSAITPLNQISGRLQHNGGVEFSTTPGASDPSLVFALQQRLRLRRISFWSNVRLFLLGLLLLSVLSFLLTRKPFVQFEHMLDRAVSYPVRLAHALAARLSGDGFICFDSYAIGFYGACLATFVVFSLADLNGSSISMYSKSYGHGAPQKTWIGLPRGSHSDEWGYVTPDILNQSLRLNRFAVQESELGAHSVALTGNIPVRHFSTIFRPQFWAFFVLPVDYAFAVYWQFKSLILLTGVFTWLLLLTGSSLWSATGSLWYFFSAFTQWSFSWPSALAEMVGLICWTMVLVCYLTAGRSKTRLFLAALGSVACAINFAMCAYPPHLVPLAWLGVIFLIAWCVANRTRIRLPEAAGTRLTAVLLAAGVIAVTGLLVFWDLRTAISAIANTVYPGRRILTGASVSPYLLSSHFLQWTETEGRFPTAIGNMCEGSGFLWLAPVTLLCLSRTQFSRIQKYALASLWIFSCMLLGWLLLPINQTIGALLLLNRTAGARILPALGLANVAIVCVTAARFRKVDGESRGSGHLREALVAAVATLFVFFTLRATNYWLGSFFSTGQLVFSAVLTAALITFLLSGRKWLLALGLLVPQVIAFGSVNPLQRGLSVITSSQLFHFVQRHPELLKGKWLIFSDSPVISGFVASTGCDVYTGTHYLPDIDHFPIFAADHLNLQLLNRLGYLDAHLRGLDEKTSITMPANVIMQWNVSPNDPVLHAIGIRYFAFDRKPGPAATTGLVPLAEQPIDGFWLYRYR